MFRLLGEERINNRMSLAIVLKSALTFLHRRRNPEFARWPGLPVPRRAVFAPLSHQFTVEVGRQPGLGRKTPSKKVHVKFETKPKRLQRRKKGKAEGGWQRPRELPASGLHWFLLKKTKQNKNNNEQWLQKRKSQVVRTDIHLRLQGFRGGGGESAASRPPFPAKRGSTTRLAHSKTFFPKKVKNNSDKYSTPQ